jgi:hypothetical protein
MRRLLAMLALTLCALVLVPMASASAATVTGECNIAGTATFSPNGLTATPQTLTYNFGGNGTCTGTLNGAPIIQAPVSAGATGTGTLSCAGAVATGGTGQLSFPNQGVTIGFHIDLVGVGSEVAFTITGNGGGNGVGHASFGSNALRATECNSPTGVNNLGFDVQAGAVNLAS